MLESLTIKNFAIIDDMTIDFKNGFSVIIGETGTGKSIIIEALNLILGSRANNSMIRQGYDKSFLTGIFSINKQVKDYLEECDIDYDDVIEIVRILNINGKSSYKINGSSVTLATINKIRDLIIEIKRQSDNEISSDSDFAIKLIDKYGSIENEKSYIEYSKLYNEYVEVKKRLNDLKSGALEIDVDYVNMQISRIDEIATYDGELEELIEKSKLCSNGFKLSELSNKIQANLKQLYDTSNEVCNDYNTFIELGGKKLADYNEINVMIEDFVNSFSYDDVSFSESEVEYIEDRIYSINKLFKLYGGDFQGMMTAYDELNEQLYQYENAEFLLEKYSNELSELEKLMFEKCELFNKIRKQYANKMADAVKVILEKMYMENAAVCFDFSVKDFEVDGNNVVKLLISTNNNTFLPIEDIASGGERARVILAFKKIIADNSDISTIIFDEVDTGVSGRVAKAMGQIMSEIALKTQVISITHLPQVAALATYCLYVDKTTGSDNVVSNIVYVTDQDKVVAIAKLLSGEQVTQEAIENAKSLLMHS